MTASSSEIEAIRRFNRFYTQKIGVLQEGLLGSEFSLAEARVLYELALRKATNATALAIELALDPGYLSRILAQFEKRGLIARAPAAEDARRRDLALTSAGRRTFAALDAGSRRQLLKLTQPLPAQQRHELIAAMRTIHGTLEGGSEPGPVLLRRHRPGDIGWVVQRHGELYAREYAWNEDFEALVATIAAEFIERLDPVRERCWIAERDGCRIGCVFLVRKTARIAKLRLLLVEPEARGIGLGRRLVEECIAFARAAGYRRLALWTQSNLDAARHVYTATGFRRIASRRHRSFGHALVAETWELAL